jgi:hypothetical protein
MKTCIKCNVEKTFAEFHRNSRVPDGRAHTCKMCRSAREAVERRARKGSLPPDDKRHGTSIGYGYFMCRCDKCSQYQRMSHIKYNFNMSEDQYSTLMNIQGGVCAVCCEEFDGAPHVDHDHTCCDKKYTCGNCVRGLLCSNCNWMIGHSRDSSEILMKGAVYLSRSLNAPRNRHAA